MEINNIKSMFNDMIGGINCGATGCANVSNQVGTGVAACFLCRKVGC